MFKKIAAFLNAFLIVFTVSSLGQAQKTAAPAPLAPATVRRIEAEVRSHYNVPAQIEISFAPPDASEITGYDHLAITFNGGGRTTTHDFLISADRKTLAHLEKFDISQDFMSKIEVKGRPVRGNAGAKVTIVNFDDFQCPFCARMHATLFPGVLKTYGSLVKIIYKDYPLTEIHPWAMHAAVAANCLAAQNNDAYWEFADDVHGKQRQVAGQNPAETTANIDRLAAEVAGKRQLDSPKLNACLKANDETAVRASMEEADKLGVDSTPTMFINGERASGALPEEALRAIIDRALVAVGEKPPPAEKAEPVPEGAKK
ncbi:MAG: DsbA family protein [Acidobacteriia bacterium]|nr:DsbA family protein [Terriglobia bacterium]